MSQAGRMGVLLLQLGTPDSPDSGPVGRYLREFLGDPRVMDIPAVPRWVLVNLGIVPLRARHSAAAYRSIWTAGGSPLRVHTESLAAGLRSVLSVPVAVGMRYGNPTLSAALDALGDVDRIVAVPLYPHYAGASWGTAVEALYSAAGKRKNVPSVDVVPPLARLPAWGRAVADLVRPHVGKGRLVFSFHGLPERQVRASQAGCFASQGCCDRPDALHGWCYRAQCFASAREIAGALQIDNFEVAFQSRVGREQWIGPSLDDTLDRLAAAHEKVVVVCPSFVADCLETLEEIGLRARARFTAGGGADFTLVPCLNAEPSWVRVLGEMILSRS